MRKFSVFFLLALSVVLTGCATEFNSQVSIFHQWPSNLKDKSYVIAPSLPQAQDLEFKEYEDILRQRLQVIGFTEARDSNAAKLKVIMRYATTLSHVLLSPTYQMELYDPFWQMHFSRRYFYSGSPFAPRPYWGGDLLNDPDVYKVYVHQLQIIIADAKTGDPLADLKASTEQFSPSIADQMSYLIESAFLHFPGKNGASYEVNLPITKE